MLGLVLEGGGAKGSFHVGAIKALSERGYYFDGVTGTSIGAINGALVAQGDLELLYRLWDEVRPSQVLDVDDEKIRRYIERDFDRSTVWYFVKLFREAIANRGLSIKKAEAFLDQYIDEDKLRESPIDFGLVTVATSDRWSPVELFKEDIPQGLLKKYIIASAYFPAFRRDPIDGKHYMDGGIYDNMPINPLIKKGYDKIIAIRTMSSMPHQKVIDDSVEVSYIIPSEKLGGTLAFTPEKIQHNIKLGYFDAQRFLDDIRGFRYYIKPQSEEAFIAYMEQLPIESFINIAATFGIHGNKRTLIIKLADIINEELEKGYSVSDAYLAMLEPVAEELGIERFEIRDFEDFFNEIRTKYNQNGDTQSNPTTDKKLNLAVYALLNSAV